MKTLKIITNKDATGNIISGTKERRLREAARAVLFDEENKIALLNVDKHSYYKLPGGGIEAGEDIKKALDREILEETGCKAKILKEIGMVVEYRDEHNLKQKSYCYLARVNGPKGTPEFTKDEIGNGFKLIWTDIGEALNLVKFSRTNDYQGKFIKIRDTEILKEVKNKI